MEQLSILFLSAGTGALIGCGIGIPLAALLVATLTFRRQIGRDFEKDEREECKQCFEDRRRLQAEMAHKDRQIFELMLAAMSDGAAK